MSLIRWLYAKFTEKRYLRSRLRDKEFLADALIATLGDTRKAIHDLNDALLFQESGGTLLTKTAWLDTLRKCGLAAAINIVPDTKVVPISQASRKKTSTPAKRRKRAR